MKIAIIAYVDDREQEKFADECNLMTYSGQELDDRFHFIIYSHPQSTSLIDKYDNVTIVSYEPPNDKYYSTYRFARSLRFVNDNLKTLDEYDYVIKTDTDTIFTKEMNNFNFNNNIYIGKGYYTNSNYFLENQKQLEDIAKSFGHPSYKKITDMHSTIICSKEDMIILMDLSDRLCKEMYYYLKDPGEWHGEKLWRGYYDSNSGICSMYALEIVLSTDRYRDRLIITDRIDGSSNSEIPWENFYHYHCYHHDYIYSKFQAKFGAYKKLNMQSGDSSAAYCVNKYIERRDLGLNYPERFAKPMFTEFKIPEDYGGYRVGYIFKKEVD